MNLYTKQKQLTHIEKKLIVIKGEKGQEINWEFGISIYTLLYIKQVTKGLTVEPRELYSMFYNKL